MSTIFKKLVTKCKTRKQARDEIKEDRNYITNSLGSSYKNAYYKLCWGCDVYLQAPQAYDDIRHRVVYFERNNIPTYVINFLSQEKAQEFMENNFFMGLEHQRHVEINLVSSGLGASITIKPTNIDYRVHIHVKYEDPGKKLVEMFRRQYIENRNLLKSKQKSQ
jgi:hypothetical protein